MIKFNSIDILEDSILAFDPKLLNMLLKDKTTHRNILWATDAYSDRGQEYSSTCPILPELITGKAMRLIQPRSSKAKATQTERTRDKAEVFTPSWVCNKQNNLIDEEWFGRADVFNREITSSWESVAESIIFPDDPRKTWKKYVDAQRLEVTCGEAPYLVSRYDTVNGEPIALHDRIGLLDRKLRVVQENTSTDDEWIKWSFRAFQSVFGYEFQGDSLLLARENLLLTFIDYYQAHFDSLPDRKLLRKIANIIAWNIWQMDGIKYVVPHSCHDLETTEYSLFGETKKTEPCPGCKNNNRLKHTGCYCIVQDWRTKEPVRFVDMMKGR